MTTYNKRQVAIVCTVAFLLMIPFTAMQFTNEVDWTASDFIIAGGLLLGTGFACELALRKIKSRGSRISVLIALLVAAFLIWAELAVGIFGTPLAGN